MRGALLGGREIVLAFGAQTLGFGRGDFLTIACDGNGGLSETSGIHRPPAPEQVFNSLWDDDAHAAARVA